MLRGESRAESLDDDELAGLDGVMLHLGDCIPGVEVYVAQSKRWDDACVWKRAEVMT